MKKQYVNGYGKTSSSAKEKLTMAVLVGMCIAAALITFFTVTLVKKWGSKDASDKLAQNTEAEIYEIADEEIEVVEQEAPEAYPDEMITERDTVSEPAEAPNNEPAAETVSSNEILTFAAPCTGEVIKEFSPTVPLYSRTLDDWRVHNGVDIHSPLGGEVCAIANGTVCDATNDFRYGYTIVIDHGKGLKSTYSNLDSIDGVSIGSKVKKGSVIAKVGDTALFETVADTHIHLEVTKDGVYVNPLSYFDLK